MSALPYIIFSIAIALIAVGAMVYVYRKKKMGECPGETDYRTFSLMGLVWMIIGGAFMIVYQELFNGLFSIGVIFFVLGLANRKKWDKARKLSRRQRNSWVVAIVLAVAMGVLLVAFKLWL